jgi:tRNA dimethylallyltransferase
MRMSQEEPLLIIVGGPTGSGKTNFSIRLAEATGASILSADSRQVFREMKIGSAAPSAEQLRRVHHFFVGTHSIAEPFNAAIFAAQSMKLLENRLFQENSIQIVCGGSGLYIHALLHGMDNLPDVQPGIRHEINEQYLREGIKPLQDELERTDPEYFGKVDLYNPQRVIRALELIRSTGKPYSSFLGRSASALPFRTLFLGMDLPREELYHRINTRVQIMMDQGWLEEARELIPFKALNALQTVGYKELFEHLEGKRSLDETIDLISQNTRRFAKRQLTWLRNREKVHWLHPEAPVNTALDLI